MAARSYMLL